MSTGQTAGNLTPYDVIVLGVTVTVHVTNLSRFAVLRSLAVNTLLDMQAITCLNRYAGNILHIRVGPG